MISDPLRNELIDTLLRVPGIDSPNPAMRNMLLVGIPNSVTFGRVLDNALGDITRLVHQLEVAFSETGDWYLLRLIDNPLPRVKEVELRDDLLQLKARLQSMIPVHIRPNPAEYAKPYRFDLQDMIRICLGFVKDSPRLSGFVVQTSSLNLLENFSLGLKYRGHDNGTWDRTRVWIPRPIVIDPRHTPVVTAIEKTMCIKQLLTKNIVIFCSKITDADDALVFWEGISAAFPATLENHLVVLMGVPDRYRMPIGARELPCPAFERRHVIDWVQEIAATMRWSEKLVGDWVGLIETLCASGSGTGGLHVDRVYYELDYFRRRLYECDTEDDFQVVLDEVRATGELYAFTY